MENNYLDKRVKDALENFEAKFQPEHWEQMEQQLNDPANADLSEDQLDHSLRSKLSDVESPLPSQHWAMMEQQLDAEFGHTEIDDIYLDGLSYEALNELQPPYDPNHWPLMKKRLEEEFSFKQKLVRYKVAELALMALILFTLVQFLPVEKISAFRLPFAHSAKEQIKTAPPSATTQADATKPLTTTTKPSSTTSTQVFANTIDEALANNENPTLNIAFAEVASPSSKQEMTTIITTTKVTKDFAPIDALPQIAALSSDVASSQTGLLSDGNQKTTTIFDNDDAGSLREMANSISGYFQAVPLIEGVGLHLLDSKTPDLPNCTDCKTSKGPSYLRIGMVGAGDLNYIMTPHDLEYNRPSYNRFESGYGGGLTLGFKFGRWEIETGALYATKSYTPDTVFVTVDRGSIKSGYVGEGWTETQLDLLRIPLRARYSFTHLGKWHLYGQGGIAVNSALNRINTIKQHYIGNSTTDLRSSPEISAPENVTTNEGLLRGGSFSENTYITVDLGFGLERFLTPRFSVFTQPSLHYSPQEKGIGLNKDRINTLSIEAGIRVSLKKDL